MLHSGGAWRGKHVANFAITAATAFHVVALAAPKASGLPRRKADIAITITIIMLTSSFLPLSDATLGLATSAMQRRNSQGTKDAAIARALDLISFGPKGHFCRLMIELSLDLAVNHKSNDVVKGFCVFTPTSSAKVTEVSPIAPFETKKFSFRVTSSSPVKVSGVLPVASLV